MNKNSGDLTSAPYQLNKLCSYFAGNDPDVTTHLLKVSLNFITTSSNAKLTNVDELIVVDDIKKYIGEHNSEDDVKQFELLYNRLKRATVLKNRTSILAFLLQLCSLGEDNQRWLILKELQLGGSNLRSNSTTSTESKELSHKQPSVKINSTSPSVLTQLTIPPMTVSGTDIHSQIIESSMKTSTFYANSATETELLQELLFAFQGIEGKILKKEPGTGGFVIDSRAGISKSHRSIVQRLAEVGYLHNQVRQHCDEPDKQTGMIGQSFIAAFRAELTEYYKLIAILQSELKKSTSGNNQSDLTLRRLLVWINEPHLRLQWLANLAVECQNKKGGALINSVYAFMHHGSKDVQIIVRRILKWLCVPLLRMITRWILDGYLEDPCGEFFIEARSVIKEERLWHDKYHVRSSMVPAFITMPEARKILVTGKSINFLREICQDIASSPERDAMLRTFETMNVEALFTPEKSSELHRMMDIAFRETSRRVLNIMRTEHRLIEHMQAFRRYLLLGQGDFIRYLLELLAPELSKSASQIYPHTLSAILDSAVRVTNAQFENPDTLKRLDVRLVEVSTGDLGWDVFTVLYHIDGPIGTVFEPTLDTYRQLFGALFKAKRMEFVLSSMLKRQITSAKKFRSLPELSSVMQHIHILTSEMVHFIHQTQYYFLFEVLECSWAEMLTDLDQAESLDDIIKAHWKFLKSVQCGVLLDSGSEELCTQLRTIYNTILKLESIVESLYRGANAELKAMNLPQFSHEPNMAGFATNTNEERRNAERLAKFNTFLQSIKTQVRSVAKYYNDHVRRYLTMLSTNTDVNLQLLSVRLDFNGYYGKDKTKESSEVLNRCGRRSSIYLIKK